MDFYLTNPSTGVRLRFPLLPDRLSVKTGAVTVALTIIKAGEVKIPRGTTLTGYSWNGTLPGESMRDASFVFDWQQPQRIIDLLRFWQDNGDTLRFMVTELSVNADVFIESFAYEYYGVDNVSYTINLTARRDLTISTLPAQTTLSDDVNTASSGSATDGVVNLKNTASFLNVRQKPSTGSLSIGRLNHGAHIQILSKSGNWYIIPFSSGIDGKAYVYSSYVSVPSQNTTSGTTAGSSGSGQSGSKAKSVSSLKTASSTCTVMNDDTLYTIAKAMLGNGSRYEEIYTLNKQAIDERNKGKSVSKYTIYPGQVLKLPAV